jgi:hypothetical protein
MTSRDVPTSDSRRIIRSLARALASRTNGATDPTNIAPAAQRSNVCRAGVTFAGANALLRAANIISQDPSFSAGAQAAAQNFTKDGNARSVPQAASSDAGSFTGQWTMYSGLGSDSEDESATPENYLPAPEGVREHGGPRLHHLLIVVGHRKTGADTTT